MFTSGYAEAKQERVTIKEVNKVAMATILDYAYTGRLQTEPDQVQAVMSAARLFQVDFICRKAADYMKNHLDVSNCADVLMYADMLGDVGLQEASGRYIAFRFNQVALQPAFLKLPLSHLQSLLNRDDLMTSSEDNIVQAALRWIEFDKEKRLQHLPALCRCFRHPFISSSQLAEVENTRKCLPTDCKLAYSDSTTQRLGQTGTEMQIFPGLVREGSTKRGIQWVAPCYDASTGELYAIDVPDNLENFSMTATPDNELYLAGGINNINSISRFGYGAQSKFYQYNHQLNSWESRHEMKSPRIRCGLVYLKGCIYAIGGDVKKKSAERYDPSCDEWTSIRPIPRPMTSDFCAVGLDDSIYVISKEGCYCFSTTENKWSKIADMIQPPLCPQAVTYQGRIYCKDCHMDSGYQSSNGVEVYNPTNAPMTVVEMEVTLSSVTFTADLQDSSTEAFQTLSAQVIAAMDSVYLDYPGFGGVTVQGFRPGSVIADIDVLIDSQEEAEMPLAVASVLQTAVTNGNGMVGEVEVGGVAVRENGVTVEVVVCSASCHDDMTCVTSGEECRSFCTSNTEYCLNGGTCQDRNPVLECRCPSDVATVYQYSGPRCQNEGLSVFFIAMIAGACALVFIVAVGLAVQCWPRGKPKTSNGDAQAVLESAESKQNGVPMENKGIDNVAANIQDNGTVAGSEKAVAQQYEEDSWL